MSSTLVRNFCIIAHIDHGKSTLADRMLQITRTVPEREMRSQFLDKIAIERERGITIKLQTIRMQYELAHELQQAFKSKFCTLNLVDTPGHIDFTYEVSRALTACEGAILLVDATQGIEAQTLANYDKAQQANLKIIPVVNKIDLPAAQPEEVALDIARTFGVDQHEVLFTSGKVGTGVNELMEAIVKRVPAPNQSIDQPLRALIFDSYYDEYQGVIAFVRVIDGQLTQDNLYLMHQQQSFTPTRIGYVAAHLEPTPVLNSGEIGYIVTGLKQIELVRVGDTICQFASHLKIQSLPGYQTPKSMVFANLFPEDAKQLQDLRAAMDRYHLTDAAFSFQPITSPILGNGFRCGFLGLLHLDVVRQRLEQEHQIPTQITAPSVEYQVTLTSQKQVWIRSPQEVPSPNQIHEIREPWCRVKIFTHAQFVGNLIKISENHRGQLVNMQYLGERVELEYRLPLAEIIRNFFDQLKSASAGYASMDYEVVDYQPVDLVKLEILLNYQPQESLARLVVREDAHAIGQKMVSLLKETLPQQQFKIPIQAVIGGQIVARETLSALKKNVTAKLYGGDRTRKDKLLQKQTAGKKRLQQHGRIRLPHSAYQQLVSI